MAITKAAQKAQRQNKRRHYRNLQKTGKLKDLIKKVKNLISQKKTEEARNLLAQVYKLLDKAAKKGLIKKNAASRKKSRITRMISKAG